MSGCRLNSNNASMVTRSASERNLTRCVLLTHRLLLLQVLSTTFDAASSTAVGTNIPTAFSSGFNIPPQAPSSSPSAFTSFPVPPAQPRARPLQQPYLVPYPYRLQPQQEHQLQRLPDHPIEQYQHSIPLRPPNTLEWKPALQAPTFSEAVAATFGPEVCPRGQTVERLLATIQTQRVVHMRGTPASGKSEMLRLLELFIRRQNKKVVRLVHWPSKAEMEAQQKKRSDQVTAKTIGRVYTRAVQGRMVVVAL
jgi:hypothetical protein